MHRNKKLDKNRIKKY